MSQQQLLDPSELLKAMRWRYAVKGFDAARTIPETEWNVLEESLTLSPSSYGLQPWKFLVIRDRALREKLKLLSWNQPQITDCSHLVVFLGRTKMETVDIDRLIARTAEVRGTTVESLKTYREMMIGDLVNGPRSANAGHWAARQTYIALGNLMTSAALLGIDTCPMEGFDPAGYDECLGLKGSGYTALVLCAAGYRSASDKYAKLPKVRYLKKEQITRIG